MTHYSYAQLEGLWIKAGGLPDLAPIAAAIAEAESSGNSTAVNPTDNNGTQTSWGLWQISNGTHSQPVPNILTPSVNARAAVAKFKADGWKPWGTFNSGAYKGFLQNSTSPDLNVPGANAAAKSGAGGAGGTTTLDAASSTSISEYDPSSCVWAFPGIAVPVLGNVGQFCIISKPELRAIIGAVFIFSAGMWLALPGVALIVAGAGMRALGAAGPVLQKTGAAVALIPGAEGIGAGVAAAGKAGSSSAAQTQQRRQQRRQRAAASEQRQMRQLGEPRENPDLPVRGGTVRETPAETRRRGESSKQRAQRYASASSSGSNGDWPPF